MPHERQSLLESRNRLTIPGVEAFQLAQRQLANVPRAIGCPVNPSIVDDDQRAIPGRTQVCFKEICPDGLRPAEGGQRVLRRLTDRTAMRSNQRVSGGKSRDQQSADPSGLQPE